ncbi:DnaJ domain-containing protein [Pisolithus microcarpus]|nr:DnaJ domain-containing protein [Pisolithus microcarpus]
MTSFPDYYALLGLEKSATIEEIRQAYKRESLKTHPDRLTRATETERRLATEKFQVRDEAKFSCQAVADAYYVLSDPARRRQYDSLYASKSYNAKSDDPKASSNFFARFANMFGSGGSTNATPNNGARPDAETVFADVFDEVRYFAPKLSAMHQWWAWMGAACGGGLGFIVANIPGLMLGAFAGNRIGAIRDAKGKSVAAVFSELGTDQKVEILRALAVKVLGSAL